MKKVNFAWLDFARIISIGLVMYGHFVMVGGFAQSVPGIISSDSRLPILNGAGNGFNLLEQILETMHTQSAVVGVTIFFLVTGFLIPGMLDRYSRIQFAVKRIFRIYPALFVSVIFTVFWLKNLQSIDFSFFSILSSVTLTSDLFRVFPVITVLWSLYVEMCFYLAAFIIGKFSYSKLTCLQIFLQAIVLIGYYFPGTITLFFARQAVFMLIICIGTSIYLIDRSTDRIMAIAYVLISVSVCHVTFVLKSLTIESSETYGSIGTIVLALSIFLVGYAVSKKISWQTPKAVKVFADSVYPLYLVHAAVGLSVMYAISNQTDSQLLIVLSGIFSSVFVAQLIHYSVEKPFIKIGKRIASKFK